MTYNKKSIEIIIVYIPDKFFYGVYITCTFFNIFQVIWLPIMLLHESSPGSPVLSSHQTFDKSFGEAQCSGGRVLQHLALNSHITRTCGTLSILAAVPQANRQIGSLCCVGCLLIVTYRFTRPNQAPWFWEIVKGRAEIPF